MIAAKEAGAPVMIAQIQPGAPIHIKSAAGIKKVSTWATQKLFSLAGVPVLPAIQETMPRCLYPGTGPGAVPVCDLLRVPAVRGAC